MEKKVEVKDKMLTRCLNKLLFENSFNNCKKKTFLYIFNFKSGFFTCFRRFRLF